MHLKTNLKKRNYKMDLKVNPKMKQLRNGFDDESEKIINL